MSVDRSGEAGWREKQRRYRASNLSDDQQPLNGGDGGGTSDGMEARVARLESDMEHVKKGVDKVDSGVSDLKKSIGDMRVDIAKGFGEVKTTLGGLEERTKHLPTRWEVFLIFSGIIAVVGGAIRLFT